MLSCLNIDCSALVLILNCLSVVMMQRYAKTIINNLNLVQFNIMSMHIIQEFEHVILESALENVVNKFRRHITIKV